MDLLLLLLLADFHPSLGPAARPLKGAANDDAEGAEDAEPWGPAPVPLPSRRPGEGAHPG